MGSGLSMTSVNKIKELAAAHEYSVAVEILDSQDLEKSLNPQFLRVCGEVYENVGRWNDARALYVKAHSMAPDAKRILFSIISLYLKMGYFSLADEYYQQYVFQTGKDTQEINNINYIMNKARETSCEELFELLYPHYADAMDETWSFELFLVAVLLRKEDLTDRLAADYCATFKSSRFCRDIEDIQTGRKKAEEFFDIYAKTVREDDDEACEEVRQFEKKQLQEDYYRMFPKEPEILEMEDDDSEIPKRVLKKMNRKEKKNRKDGDEDDIEEEISEPAAEPADSENLTLDEKTEAVKKSLKSVIRKKFKKKKEETETKAEEESVEETETKVENEPEEEPEAKAEDEPEEEPEAKAEDEPEEEPEAKAEDEPEEEPEIKAEDEPEEEPEIKVEDEPEEEPEIKVEDEPEIIVEPEEDWEEDAEEDTVQLENAEEAADSQDGNDKESEDMQELRPESNIDDIVTYDFDDGFAPESDTISGLSGEFEEDYANPFDSINAYKIDDRERRMSEAALSGKSMEDMRIELEINNVDDSENLLSEDSATDEDTSDNAVVNTEEKTDISTDENAEEEVIITSDFESDNESDFESDDFESDFEADDFESDYFEIQIGDSEIEVFDDTAEEIEPEEISPEDVETEEIEPEEAEPEEAEPEEAEPEEIGFEAVEPEEIEPEETGPEETGFEDIEPEETEPEESNLEAVEPEETEPEEVSPEAVEPEQTETQNTEYQPGLDYPEFRSSLFPNLNRKQDEVQNTFDSVMKEEQEKLQERLLQEEKMQREAEELLASLGIKL